MVLHNPRDASSVGGIVGSRMATAPTDIGKLSELPKPYAWNIGPTEKKRSSGAMSRMDRA